MSHDGSHTGYPPRSPDLEGGLGDPTPQTLREGFNPDGSDALFSMYLDRAIEEDRRMVESWKRDADGILAFIGLFSAAIAALLSLSVPTILRNPQDTSSFYLARIYQQSFTQPNGSQPPIPSSLADPVEPFVPPTSGVWVNGLWFSSLVISLACALCATLIQQWARRYERVSNTHYGPHKRARIRAFYKEGAEKWRIPNLVEALPMLLHISLFVFFAGLSVFLFGVHRTIFKTVTLLIGICVISYGWLSLFPIIQKESLYSTPFSMLFSFFITGIRYSAVRMFPSFGNFICKLLIRDPEGAHPYNFFSRSMIGTAEKYALTLKPDIDHRSLLWTFKSLGEDGDLEKFFEGLLRLCDSASGKKLELKENFIDRYKDRLSNALIGLMDRTLSFNMVEEFVKHRRMVIFTKIIESKSTSLIDPSQVLHRVLTGDWHGFLEFIDFGLSMRHWAKASPKVTVSSFYAQCVATRTISTIQNRDKRWIQLATVNAQPLSKSLHPDDDYHSILLTNAIYVVRMTVQTYSGSEDTDRHDILDVSRKTIGSACKLNIQETLPELRDEFCDLWNKLVNMAQTDERPHPRFVSLEMLRNIRELFIALHGTHRTAFNAVDAWEPVLDNPGFYPKCTEKEHRSSSSFPDLQVNALTQPEASTPREMHVHFPQPLTWRITSSSSSPPSQHPSPLFPVENPFV